MSNLNIILLQFNLIRRILNLTFKTSEFKKNEDCNMTKLIDKNSHVVKRIYRREVPYFILINLISPGRAQKWRNTVNQLESTFDLISRASRF